jgi:Fe-S oxidoreductase
MGRLLPALAGARDISPESMAELADACFGRCTACGRCAIHCAIGLDVTAVIRTGRRMLAAAGQTPEGLRQTLANQITTGNQMAIPRDEFISTLQWLTENLRDEMNDPSVSIPLDAPGHRVLYLVNPREVKVFPLSLMAAAGIFHAAGESWTLSSRCYDVTNYGLFAGNDAGAAELVRRAVDEAAALQVEEIVLSECGHGFRALRWEGPNWLGRRYSLPVRSVLELLDEYLASGRIEV